MPNTMSADGTPPVTAMWLHTGKRCCLPHGALLGLEEIEECRAESEIDCQAAAQEDPNIIKTEDFNEQA